ncbi:MAG: UDP-glucose 4-epimerase GalE [Acidobacteriota bacterium]|jgi:UDP-glucose 4-epimerase
MHILVTGGVGYVGSHLVRALLDAGHTVVVVDDLSSGHPETLPQGVDLHEGRCGDAAILDRAAAATPPDAVMHVAAKCSVEESVHDPRLYYRANLRDSLDLLDWMVTRDVGMLVHSSTCAVYGSPDTETIDETTCPRPMNPYGASKLAVDLAMQGYEDAFGVRGIALRYFNAAGAHPDGSLGEDKKPASNLIPILFEVALGLRDEVLVFGTDYPTADGTGVRDYIHVMDLAAAHIAALERLAGGARGAVYNLGTGNGHSVREMLAHARAVTGHEIPAREAPRRAGDPALLVADPRRAAAELGWHARAGIDEILADAWRWREAHPHGYRGEAES